MKLKYYLRGLGTGILFATLILFISYSYNFSDAKIKERAKEMGMVETESTKQSMLDNITTTTTNSASNNETTTSEKENDETSSIETTTTKENETSKVQETTTKKEETTSKEETTTENDSLTEYVITISKGMSSESVAEALEVMGVIDSAREFNDYLIKNGHSERVRIGTFVIPKGSTYEEIADIISS